MSPTLHLHPQLPAREGAWPAQHVLLVLPPAAGKRLPAGLPDHLRAPLQAALARRGQSASELVSEGCVISDARGTLFSLAILKPELSAFERGTMLRKALQPLLAEQPQVLSVAWLLPVEAAEPVQQAIFAACVNAAVLPVRKSGKRPRVLAAIHFHSDGPLPKATVQGAQALADANTLARTLTLLPANELDPAAYRGRIRALAREHGWKLREYTVAQLKRMKAGAFLAVAQGSDNQDAAIVHLSWKPRGARRRIALVGKGICFDTGGHNLKNARGMFGMHEDMNGSAVALASLQALSTLRVPVEVHCFLALAQNHLSPRAYKQNEVITALNGTTIEIVHTDAEGRMVLADALTLASREAPELIVDFATLTGSMVTALGTYQSGVIASRPALEELARSAARSSGERVVCFAAEADYDAALDSKVADIKQCLMEGEADHLLAARFLNRFKGDADWIHMDLSSYRHAGGLGAVASDVNGFGVAWTCALIREWLASAVRAGRAG